MTALNKMESTGRCSSSGICIIEALLFTTLPFLAGCSRVEIVEETSKGEYYTGTPVIEWADIPSGEYDMRVYQPKRTDETGIVGQSIERTVTIDAFRMSATEITNRQYCMFLNEALKKGENIKVEFKEKQEMIATGSIREVTGGGTLIVLKSRVPGYRNEFNGSGIMFSGGIFRVVPGQEEHPVVNVTPYGAEAFAEFHGWTLPTEAQWEYAARGGNTHTFGTAGGNIDGGLANYDNNNGHTLPIKSYAPNGYGLYDMCGNAAEWCIGQLRYRGVTNTSIGIGRYSHPKGGSWLSYEDACRIRSNEIHDRYFKYPYSKNEKAPYLIDTPLGIHIRNNHGFRVVTRVVNR